MYIPHEGLAVLLTVLLLAGLMAHPRTAR